MTIEIILHQRIFYLRRIGSYGEKNIQLMNEFKEKVAKAKLFKDDTIIYGIPWSEPNVPKEECIYDVCVIVSQNQQLIEGLEEANLEGGKYAIFQVEHTQEAVKSFWLAFKESAFQKKYLLTRDFKRPVLERYSVEKIAAGYCEFCIPVK